MIALPMPRPPLLSLFIEECRPHLAGAIGFSALVNLLYLAPTIYMMQVYDRAVPAASLSTLFFLTAVILVALAALASLDAVRKRLLAQSGLRLDRKLGPVLVQQGLESAGLTRLSSRNFEQLRQFLSGPAMLALFDAPWAPIYVAAAFLIHPALGIFILAGGALLVLIAVSHDRATRSDNMASQKAQAEVYAQADDLGGASEAASAMGMIAALRIRHLSTRSRALHLAAAAETRSATAASLTKFARLALQSGALGFGAWLAISQQISAGAIIAASVLMSRALQPIEQIVGSWQGITQMRLVWRGLDAQLSRHQAADSMPLPNPAGRLTVDQITYRHPDSGAVILRQISFDVDPGELVVVAGPSGSGKSTLARLLVGVTKPTLGAVRLDGASLSDWPRDQIGRHIGYLPQQPMLVEGSIRDNISRFALWRGDEATDVAEAVVNAAIAAGVHSTILGLRGAYDAVLGPGGSGISAGQAQRLALARALYGSPALVVMDEPNAAQDFMGERALMETLARLRAQGTATIVIAHRGPIASLADRLLTLSDGRIDRMGSPAELIGSAMTEPEPAPGPMISCPKVST